MPPKTGAKVRLGGKLRTLRYTAPALGRVQDELDGEPLLQTVNSLGQVSLRTVAVMVWGGLLHDDQELSVEAAAELIEPPLKPIIDGIVEALGPWIESEPAEPGKPAAKS